MDGDVGSLMTSEIELRQQLSALEGEWLTSCLHAKDGVAAVKWAAETRRLFIVYNAETFGSAELIDFLHTCGIPVASLRVGYAYAESVVSSTSSTTAPSATGSRAFASR